MSSRKKTELLVVHVTATNPSSRLSVSSLRAMHKRRGFSDIGYNEWIDRDGVLQPGRGVDAIGAHVQGYNSIAYGISLEGGLNEFDATPAMMVTLEQRLHAMAKRYPGAKVCGHRDLSPDLDGDGIIEPSEHIKLCPQFNAIPWAQSHGLPPADIRGVWSVHGQDGPDARDRWLQKLLRGLGYPVGPVDGIVGPKTRDAIALFQEDAGISVTEAFDRVTVDVLRARAGA
ncbi:peptidoglycan recognition protein family protein [Martelella endophytica]|uniref:peptidoglycan recognition protein family protein n=1 Tax=Martelella endophytica TaxID=1486262 RepID=UPI000695AAE0|nr:peptidoglycan-binding domain-containing protein [Martelella endophytica]